MHHHLPQVKKTWFKITKKGRVLHCMAAMVGCVCLAGPAMAAFPINNNVTATQTLNDGESGTITSTGSISVVDNVGVSISGTTDITLINNGSILSAGDNADAYGVDGSSLYDSSITNSGTITATSHSKYATGIYLSNSVNFSEISNSGTIAVTSDEADAIGIYVYDGVYESTIENSGTISATSTDGRAEGIFSEELLDGSISNTSTGNIYVSGDVAVGMGANYLSGNSTISNAGLIRAESSGFGAVGMGASFLDNGTSITNSGKIEVSNSNEDYAIWNIGMLAYSTAPGSVIANEGTITVTSSAGVTFDAGIFCKYGDATIRNSGTITLTQSNTPNWYYVPAAGILTLPGMVPSLAAQAPAATQTIFNSGVIQALNSDGFVSNSSFSVYAPNATILNESNGVLKGLLYTENNLENQGTIYLPLPSTTDYMAALPYGPKAAAPLPITTVNSIYGYSGRVGSLVSSGTIGITLFNDDNPDNTRYSILLVDGNAELLDDSTIHVDVQSASQDQPLMIGQTLAGIIRAGSITADLDLLNTTDNSALLKFTPVLSNEDTWLDLNIEQDRTILQATISAGKKGVLGAAGALDELTDGDDPDLNSFIGELFTYETDEEVAQGVAQASPVNATTSPTVANAMFNTMSSVVRARLQSVRGFNSGEQLFSDRNLWVKPLGAHTEQDSRDGINGFSANSYGFGLGADGEYSVGKRLGLAFFYTGADVDSKGVIQDNDLQVFNLMAYGSNPLLDDSTELFYQAGGGLQATDSRRYISAIDETAKADFTARSLFAQLKGTKTLYPSDKLKTMFGLGLSYMYYYNPSYHETGAGGLNLDVDSFDSNALVASLEGDLFYDLGNNFRLLASAAIGYDLIDDDTSVTSNFQGDNSVVFATDGIDNSPFIFKLGAGIAKNIQDNLSVDLKYDLDGRSSDYLNHVVTAQLNWKF